MLRACGIAIADDSDGPLGGIADTAHRKNAEATHATHRARLVTGVRASGRRAESDAGLTTERRPLLHYWPGHFFAASAIESASRAPACSAWLLSTNHAPSPFGVPEANPRAAAR